MNKHSRKSQKNVSSNVSKPKVRKSSSSRKKKTVKKARWRVDSIFQCLQRVFKRNGETAPWVIWLCVSLVGLIYLFATYYFFFKPYLLRSDLPDEYYTRPYVHGIDISHHQGEIDWPKLKVAYHRGRPVTFVFMKATEGADFVDENFQYNFKTARERGFVCGAYHFFLPDVPAELQAKNFISQVKLQSGDLPPVLDVEVLGKGGVEPLRQGVSTWLSIVERHYGIAPIIYASYSFWSDNLENSSVSSYPFWIAHYNVEELKYSGAWKFWQHTDRGRIDGIRGHVDLNVFNGTQEELMRLTIR